MSRARSTRCWQLAFALLVLLSLSGKAYAQAATCSKQWLWQWCGKASCEAAEDCLSAVVDYWTKHKSECENDVVAVKEKVELSCQSCNKQNCKTTSTREQPTHALACPTRTD